MSAHWFAAASAALQDMRRSAELAAENSGTTQRLHHHAYAQPCNADCEDIGATGVKT